METAVSQHRNGNGSTIHVHIYNDQYKCLLCSYRLPAGLVNKYFAAIRKEPCPRCFQPVSIIELRANRLVCTACNSESHSVELEALT